jgi:ribonuclease-3
MHKSLGHGAAEKELKALEGKGKKGKGKAQPAGKKCKRLGRPLYNEILEYLGDAILDAVVGHVAYQYFPGKAEGFLTNARSKMVQRETLGKLAQQMGLSKLIMSSGCNITHNSYMGGNAFEALVGAVYLDRGYEACQEFWTKRVMGKYLNVNKIAYTDVNFKSKILEWSQKNRVKIEFRLEDQSQDENGSPTFEYTVVLEGIDGCRSRGFSKKESQQHACELTLKKLRSDSQFFDSIFAAKTARTQMEEMPVSVVPVVENIDEPLITLNSQTEDEPEAMEKTREQIIAEAEAQAYSVHSA